LRSAAISVKVLSSPSSIAAFAIVQHRAAQAFHRLLRAMHRRYSLAIGTDWPERSLVGRALPMAGGTLPNSMEAVMQRDALSDLPPLVFLIHSKSLDG
jgi:hypothetical protein